LLLHDIGIVPTLALNERLSTVATDSFVASTSLVLVLAGVALLLAAGSCGRLLRSR
jgi:hypothetical protein